MLLSTTVCSGRNDCGSKQISFSFNVLGRGRKFFELRCIGDLHLICEGRKVSLFLEAFLTIPPEECQTKSFEEQETSLSCHVRSNLSRLTT